MNSICPACPYDLKIIRVVTPAVLPAVGRAPYKRKGNHCYLCWFVRMDMMDLLPRLELASATLGFEAPYLGEVMPAPLQYKILNRTRVVGESTSLYHQR